MLNFSSNEGWLAPIFLNGGPEWMWFGSRWQLLSVRALAINRDLVCFQLNRNEEDLPFLDISYGVFFFFFLTEVTLVIFHLTWEGKRRHQGFAMPAFLWLCHCWPFSTAFFLTRLSRVRCWGLLQKQVYTMCFSLGFFYPCLLQKIHFKFKEKRFQTNTSWFPNVLKWNTMHSDMLSKWADTQVGGSSSLGIWTAHQ